ncbi:hypothetical protein BGZ76_007913, partial [Entomortierella beljakovae]
MVGGRSQFHSVRLYKCYRAGETDTRKKPRRQYESGEPKPIKTRKKYKSPLKVGCQAKLIVHEMKDDVGGESRQFRVTYYYKHTGHVLGHTNDFQHIKMTDSTRARIRHLVRLGLNTRRVAARINLSRDLAFRQHGQCDDVFTYDDVYNVYHKFNSQLTRLADDDHDSMRLWMT